MAAQNRRGAQDANGAAMSRAQRGLGQRPRRPVPAPLPVGIHANRREGVGYGANTLANECDLEPIWGAREIANGTVDGSQEVTSLYSAQRCRGAGGYRTSKPALLMFLAADHDALQLYRHGDRRICQFKNISMSPYRCRAPVPRAPSR